MNAYRNRKTGVVIEIPSEFGCNEVWEKISPAPNPAPLPETVKAEPKKEPKKETPKKTATTRKAVKK